MHIATATDPGTPGRPNEDFAATAFPAAGSGGALVVLDGVTPHPQGTGCGHGVPWYTARLGGALLELSALRPDLTLGQGLAGAIERTARSHAATCDLYHAHTPQATVVAVRWNADEIEYLVLSDSTLLIEEVSGEVRAVVDDRLARLPEPVPALRAALRALPPGAPERAGVLARYVRAVESLRNAEGGFFTAAADPSVARRAVTGRLPRSRIRSVAALTDGAARLVDVFGTHDWPSALALLHTAGPQALIDRVRAAEAADPDGTRFPRGKRHDDATAVLARL